MKNYTYTYEKLLAMRPMSTSVPTKMGVITLLTFKGF